LGAGLGHFKEDPLKLIVELKKK